MNKTISYVLSVLVGCILFSCTTKTSNIERDLINGFPEPVILTGRSIESNDGGVSSIWLITYMDSMLVVNTDNNDKLISIYNRWGKHMKSFGRSGQGPTDFNNLPIFYDFHTDEDLSVTDVDNNLLMLDKINLTESIKKRNRIVESTYEFPGYTRRIASAYYINEQRIIGIYNGHSYRTLDKKTGIFEFNPSTAEFETKPLQNVYFNRQDSLNITYFQNLSNLNTWSSDISPSKKYFVVAMKHSPFLNIYIHADSSLTKTGSFYLGKEIIEHEFYMDEFENWNYPEMILDVDVTDHYIYVLYNKNKAIDEESKETQVMVIDWEGNPISLYQASEKYDIAKLTVNETDSIFYGLSYSQDAIYKFDYSSRQ